jgi:hypothetical protein
MAQAPHCWYFTALLHAGPPLASVAVVTFQGLLVAMTGSCLAQASGASSVSIAIDQGAGLVFFVSQGNGGRCVLCSSVQCSNWVEAMLGLLVSVTGRRIMCFSVTGSGSPKCGNFSNPDLPFVNFATGIALDTSTEFIYVLEQQVSAAGNADVAFAYFSQR